MDSGTSKRGPGGGGQKGQLYRTKRNDQRAERKQEKGDLSVPSGMSPRTSSGRGRKAQHSGRPNRKELLGNIEPRPDPGGLIVPTAQRTVCQRRPRDISQDGFLRELLSLVSVDTPKEREVAEALFNLANFFHSTSLEDEGSADYHPSKAYQKRNNASTVGSDYSQKRGNKSWGSKISSDVGRWAVNKSTSSRAHSDGQSIADPESDLSDSDGASASWKNPAERGEKMANRLRVPHVRKMHPARIRMDVRLERVKKASSAGFQENGESVGNSQVGVPAGEMLLRNKRGVDRSASVADGAAAVPQAKRTRSIDNKDAWTRESARTDNTKGGKEGVSLEVQKTLSSHMDQQHQPFLRTIVDAIQGAYVRGLLSQAVKGQNISHVYGSNGAAVGGVNVGQGDAIANALPWPLSMQPDLQAMLQIMGPGAMPSSTSGSKTPLNSPCDKAVPVPANLRRSFVRNCTHVYIAQFIRWHKQQLYQDGKSPSMRSQADGDSYSYGTHEERYQSSETPKQDFAKQPGRGEHISSLQALPSSGAATPALQVSRPVAAARMPTGAPGPKSSTPVIPGQYNPQASSPYFPMPSLLHGNMNPANLPPTAPHRPGWSGSHLGANATSSQSPMLAAMRIQCRRPQLAPSGMPSLNNVIGGGAAGGNLLGTEMTPLLMSTRGGHSTEGMALLQILAAGCTPDGKPLPMNPAAPLGILPNQYVSDGFK